MAFDGNGRLFVAEMSSYMRDINGTDELVSTSRVSVHWSSKGDGQYDMHRVFADKLKLPRLLLPLADGVLIGETDTNDIYLYKDTNGDGVSDEKKPVYQGGPRGGNLEHQPSGMTWALDNWIYTAVNNYRLRWKDGQLIKHDIPGNGGQWKSEQGIGHGCLLRERLLSATRPAAPRCGSCRRPCPGGRSARRAARPAGRRGGARSLYPHLAPGAGGASRPVGVTRPGSRTLRMAPPSPEMKSPAAGLPHRPLM